MQQNSQGAGISSEDDDLGSTPVLIAEFVLVLCFAIFMRNGVTYESFCCFVSALLQLLVV